MGRPSHCAARWQPALVSTARNTLLWLAPDGSIQREWKAPGDRDSRHMNSVFVQQGRVLVSAFGDFLESQDWRDHRIDGSGLASVRGGFPPTGHP